jgi:uncharacterized membrane protein YfcA
MVAGGCIGVTCGNRIAHVFKTAKSLQLLVVALLLYSAGSALPEPLPSSSNQTSN